METLCRMWLSTADGLTRTAQRYLKEKYQSAEAFFRDFSGEHRKILGDKCFQILKDAKDRGLLYIPRQLQAIGARVVSKGEAGYPGALAPLPDSPDLLYILGEMPKSTNIAMVGSRHDTRYGREMAFKIARDLSDAGVSVVSGLARGIDTASHRGALAGRGQTVAVLGCGLDIVYPPENKDLLKQILDKGGAAVSEYPPGTPPMPYHFPLRNRIISGLSEGVLLIEATQRSGTMSTVNHALNQGKTVFALPGNVDSPGSELPLQLLREGAEMCTCALDILQYFHIDPKENDAPAGADSRQEPSDDPILRALFREEKTFDELSAESGLNPAELSARLSELELDGKVEKCAGRTWTLVR